MKRAAKRKAKSPAPETGTTLATAIVKAPRLAAPKAARAKLASWLDEIARSAGEAQTRAMEEAARMLFRTEVGPALQRVAVPLQHMADLAHRGAHLWQRWLTHAATAFVASGLTWAVAAFLWVR